MSTKVGTIHTPNTKKGGYPYYGNPVNLYLGEGDPAGMCHACEEPAELGLPESHPTIRRPDLGGGLSGGFLATLIQLVLHKRDTCPLGHLPQGKGLQDSRNTGIRLFLCWACVWFRL